MNVPGLRSPYEKVGGVYYVPRMFDKIRLHAAGKLPEDYHANLGKGFDGRALSFLEVDYDSVVNRVKEGGTDEELLAWCFEHGRHPGDEQIEVWNGFMSKRGWRDEGTPTLLKRLKEIHCEDRTDIQTSFDFIELDEERDPRAIPAPYYRSIGLTSPLPQERPDKPGVANCKSQWANL